MEAFPRLVQVRLIAWKKRRLTIELLNFPKLSSVQATFRQRALHVNTKSVLILLQGGHDSSRVIQPLVQLLLDEPNLLIQPCPSAFEIGLARSHALQGWRAHHPRFRSLDIQRPHSRRDAPDIVPNGFGASPCFRPALPFSTGLMECLDTSLRECFQCVLRVSRPRVRLLRLRKAVVEVGEPLRHVVEPTVQISQLGVALFYPPGFRWNQPGKNILDSRLLDGKSLQLVLGEELRRPSFVRRRCGVAAGTIDIDDRRTGAEDVATSDLHLLPDRFVVRQRGIDVDPKAVQKRALPGHAAPDDAGHVGAEPNLGAGAPLHAEERGGPVNVHLFEPGTLVQGDVGGVPDRLHLSVAAALETDAHS